MKRRERWLKEVAEVCGRMLWGSMTEVYRRCGRPTCHCARGEKHGPVFYLSRHEGGRTRNILIPGKLRRVVEEGAAAYRRYRELGQGLAEENLRALGLGGQRRGRPRRR